MDAATESDPNIKTIELEVNGLQVGKLRINAAMGNLVELVLELNKKVIDHNGSPGFFTTWGLTELHDDYSEIESSTDKIMRVVLVS
jgi:hypothetical protein